MRSSGRFSLAVILPLLLFLSSEKVVADTDLDTTGPIIGYSAESGGVFLTRSGEVYTHGTAGFSRQEWLDPPVPVAEILFYEGYRLTTVSGEFWRIDGETWVNKGRIPGAISAEISCIPTSGTIPFQTAILTTISSNYEEYDRLVAARIDVRLADGVQYSNLYTGFTTLSAGEIFTSSWPETIPEISSVLGENMVTLVIQDVTPSPFNQPPYPPAGETMKSTCTVTGIAP